MIIKGPIGCFQTQQLFVLWSQTHLVGVIQYTLNVAWNAIALIHLYLRENTLNFWLPPGAAVIKDEHYPTSAAALGMISVALGKAFSKSRKITRIHCQQKGSKYSRDGLSSGMRTGNAAPKPESWLLNPCLM